MTNPQGTRRTYEDSCRQLQKAGWLDSGAIPRLRATRPNYDDEELGVQFFRTRVQNEAFENLTLPRTFFGRSEIKDVSFAGTDLSESTLCWNDFIGVDFSHCDLSKSDLRAARFESVKFAGANLQDTDLRRSDFKDCDFSNASLRGTKLTKRQGQRLHLSPLQQQEADWQELDGEEPGGG